jgi:hypothetical protein
MTIEEHLSILPEQLRQQVIFYTNKQESGRYDKYKMVEALTYKMAIYYLFDPNKTDEGHDFWINLEQIYK